MLSFLVKKHSYQLSVMVQPWNLSSGRGFRMILSLKSTWPTQQIRGDHGRFCTKKPAITTTKKVLWSLLFCKWQVYCSNQFRVKACKDNVSKHPHLFFLLAQGVDGHQVPCWQLWNCCENNENLSSSERREKAAEDIVRGTCPAGESLPLIFSYREEVLNALDYCEISIVLHFVFLFLIRI